VIESMLYAMDGPLGTKPCRSLFEIRQRDDADGALRATLIGELDLSATDRLRAGLDQLQRSKRRVRLDLSELEFIDCRGVGTILSALAEARRNGWDLEVDRLVSPIVGRIVSLTEIGSSLWPAATVAVAARPASSQG
jgi:anti-sigma B factor antagonist